MNRLLAAATLVAIFSTLLASARAAAPRYRVTQLNAIATAAGTYAAATAINDRGQVVGGESAFTPSTLGGYRLDWTKIRPIAWTDTGTATLLPKLTNYGGIAEAINNAGLIAGNSGLSSAAYPDVRATLFRSTGATLIPSATGSTSYSRVGGVNASGVLLIEDSASSFTYNSNTNTFAQLTNGSTTYVDVVSMDDDGSAIANLIRNTSSLTPARLRSGVPPTYLYASTTAYGYSADSNNKAMVVGNYVSSSSSAGAPAIFAIGAVTLLSLQDATRGTALGINDRGDIVGRIGTGAFNNGNDKAFLRRDGVMIDLSTLIVDGVLPAGFVPVDINDRGQIIGNIAVDDDSNPNTPKVGRAYILNPVRTPGDTNYDDAVNFADLLALAQNYNKSGDGNVFWESGDFNFDWSVDFNDLLTLAQNYNSPATFQADYALAMSMVPEPATAIAGVALAGILCRRRRS